MQHPDEGMIHAWIDGALDSEAARELEVHLAECPECARVAAEARGLVAASSRILTALDNVPDDVIPISGAAAAKQRRVTRRWATPFWARTAASVLIIAGVSALVMTGKLNSPERKRADMARTATPALEQMAVALDTQPMAAAPPASDLASATSAARKSTGPATPAAAPHPFSARGEVSSSSRQKVATAPASKDEQPAILAKEAASSDKLARDVRVAEVDQAQKSSEMKKTMAAAAPTDPARRDAASNAAADVRGMLSDAQRSVGRAAVGGARAGQGAAAPSLTAPTTQSMAAPSETRPEMMTTGARMRAATGCYALTLSPWSGGTIPFGAPPARIELDSLTSVQEAIRGLHLVHPARGAASNGVPLAYWRTFGDSAHVTWRDELRGVTLTIPLSGEVVRGSARTFSTSARDGAAQTADVEARRISCRE